MKVLFESSTLYDDVLGQIVVMLLADRLLQILRFLFHVSGRHIVEDEVDSIACVLVRLCNGELVTQQGAYI